MKNHKFNVTFKCKCNLNLGTCENLDHPRKMEAIAGTQFVEGWSLGKYNGRKGKYGQLVYDYKWLRESSVNSYQKDPEETANEVFEAALYFVRNYFNYFDKYIDTVFPVPGSTGKHASLAKALTKRFAAEGYKEIPNFLQIKPGDSVRSQSGKQARMQILNQQVSLSSNDAKDFGARGVLFLDDVYETGATMTHMANLFRQIDTATDIYFLTVAYDI